MGVICTSMKLVLWVILAPIVLIILLLGSCAVYLSLSDEYVVLEQEVSPDGSRVGVIIGNNGGGGAGWCRDLVYNFPNTKPIPNITSNNKESKYENHLVKQLECGEAKSISWENKELIIN